MKNEWKGGKVKKRRERETVNETKSLCVACKSSLIKVKFVFLILTYLFLEMVKDVEKISANKFHFGF